MELTKQTTSNINELYFSCEAAERTQLEPLTEKLKQAGYQPRFEASSDFLSKRAYVLVLGAQGITPAQQADLKQAQKWASRDQQYRLFAGNRGFRLVIIRLPGASDPPELKSSGLNYSVLDFRAGVDATAAEKLIQALNAPPPESQLAIEPVSQGELVLQSEPGTLEVSPEEASPGEENPPIAPQKPKPPTANRKLLIYAAFGLVALLIILALAEVRNQKQQNQLTTYQKLVAEEKQQIALSRELAANANLYTKTDPQLSLLLAVEAAKTFPTSEAELALRQAVTRPVPRKLPFGSPSAANLNIVISVFSQDGRFMALSLAPKDSSQPWLVQVWDVLKEQKVAELKGTISEIYTLVFSPNNALLFTEGNSQTGQVWEIASQKVLYEVKSAHLGAIFSPNSGLLAVWGFDTSYIRVLDANSGQEIFKVENIFVDQIYRAGQGLAFSPDSKLLAQSFGKSMQVYEIATGKILPGFDNDSVSRGGVTFSPDGKLLAEIAQNNNVRLWEVETGKLRSTLDVNQGIGEVWRLVFSPDGGTIAASGYNDATNLLSVRNGRYDSYIQGDFVAWSPDGRYILAKNSRTKTLYLTDASDGQILAELPHTGEITDARFLAEGKTVVSMDSAYYISPANYQSIWRWEVAPKTARTTIKASNRPITRLAFSPDGRLLAHSSFDNTAQVLDVSSGQVLATLRGHTEDVLKVVFSPDGKLLVTSSRDGTARLWEAATGRSKGVLLGHTKVINDAVFSPDSKYLVTVSDDFTARIWEVESGRTVMILSSRAALSSVLFSPDGKRLVTFGSNLPQLWEADTGKLVKDLDSGRNLVHSAVFSPDGKYLFLGGYTESAQVVEAATGLKVADLGGKFGELREAIFSPDGKRITTTEGSEGTGWLVRSWDSRTGQEIGHFPPNFNGTYGASVFSPDGKFGAVLTNKSVFVWEVGTGVTLSQIPLEDTFFVQSNMAFSPDSRVLAMGSSVGDIRLFALPECGGVADLLGLASYKSYRELTPAEREQYLHQ